MGILTADMKRVVEEQRLGFVATVCVRLAETEEFPRGRCRWSW